MESKMNLENDFVEWVKGELASDLNIDDHSAYIFALNLTEALSASNADLPSIKKLFYNI